MRMAKMKKTIPCISKDRYVAVITLEMEMAQPTWKTFSIP